MLVSSFTSRFTRFKVLFIKVFWGTTSSVSALLLNSSLSSSISSCYIEARKTFLSPRDMILTASEKESHSGEKIYHQLEVYRKEGNGKIGRGGKITTLLATEKGRDGKKWTVKKQGNINSVIPTWLKQTMRMVKTEIDVKPCISLSFIPGGDMRLLSSKALRVKRNLHLTTNVDSITHVRVNRRYWEQYQ